MGAHCDATTKFNYYKSEHRFILLFRSDVLFTFSVTHSHTGQCKPLFDAYSYNRRVNFHNLNEVKYILF